MTLKELPKDDFAKDYRIQLPKLDGNEVTVQWSCRWYDGPLSGVATHRGQPCWFENRHDDEFRPQTDSEGEAWNDWFKPFLLIGLTAEQYQDCIRLRASLQQVYQENFRADIETDQNKERVLHPRQAFQGPEEWAIFYNAEWKKVTSDNHITGWFEWLWASAEQE